MAVAEPCKVGPGEFLRSFCWKFSGTCESVNDIFLCPMVGHAFFLGKLERNVANF